MSKLAALSACVLVFTATLAPGVAHSAPVPGSLWYAYPANCRSVLVQSAENKKFVATEKDWDSRLRARTDGRLVDDWETYTLYGNGNNYSLRAFANGKWVAAELEQDTRLVARSDVIDSWERFTIETIHEVLPGVTRVYIRSTANQKYVATEIEADATLRARTTHRDTWEQFDIHFLSVHAYRCQWD